MFGIPLNVILTIGSAVASFWMKHMALKRQDQKEIMLAAIHSKELNNKIANDANKRGSPVFRMIIGITIVFVAFFGLFIAAFSSNIPVSYIYETNPHHSFLFGLIKWGGTKIKTITANGFVIAPYMTNSINVIIGFLFGSSFARNTR